MLACNGSWEMQILERRQTSKDFERQIFNKGSLNIFSINQIVLDKCTSYDKSLIVKITVSFEMFKRRYIDE